MGRSQGEAGVFFDPQDVDDHARAIAWAAEQPWCNGDVVLFGTSYYGMTQPLVAVRRPPALKAFFCNEICTDYFRHLDAVRRRVRALLRVTVGRRQLHRTALPPARAADRCARSLSHITNGPLHPLLERTVMKRVDAIYRSFMRKTPVRPVREWYANWMIDGKTRAATCLPAGPSDELDKIEVPFVVVQNLGYFNLHQFGSYDLFENAATPADRKWMILAPPRYELPVYAWQLEAIAFFDHVLRGADNGYGEQPAVRYWLDGEERFVGAASFPVPGQHAGAVLSRLGRRGPREACARPRGAGAGRQFLGGDPARRAGARRHRRRAQPDARLRGDDRCRHRILRSGHRAPALFLQRDRLRRSSRASAASTPAAAITSCRWARSARRGGGSIPARSTACEIAIDTESPRPLTPGEPVPIVFSLTPAPTRLRRGEKLRLDIASRTDLLKSDVSHGYAQFDLPVPPYFSRNTMHYGPDSYLELHRVRS